MKKIAWGVLGTAKIAKELVIPASKACKNAEFIYVASREWEKAKNMAASLGIEGYGSYDDLLANPDVDAIYIPLPNHLHFEYIKKAAEVGKHVLCEKPLALGLHEVKKLMEIEKETSMKIGEAFMVHSHPRWKKAKDIVGDGMLGNVKFIRGMFSYYNDNPENVRNKYEHGGGGTWDIAVYPIHTARMVLQEEPLEVWASMDLHPEFMVDVFSSGIVKFPSCQLNFTASTMLAQEQSMTFFGEDKKLEVPLAFTPKGPTELLLHSGPVLQPKIERISIPACDQYTLQIDEFSEAILENIEVPVPLCNTLYNTATVLALFESAKTGKWTKVVTS